MDNYTYHFDEQHLIVAYMHNRFLGIFLTYPDESFTKEQLLEVFPSTAPTHLVAAKVPGICDLTPENYQAKLEDVIGNLMDNNLDDLDIQCYIPRVLH